MRAWASRAAPRGRRPPRQARRLVHQPSEEDTSAGAERTTDRERPPPLHVSRRRQACDVDAGQQQQDRGAGDRDRKRRTLTAPQLVNRRYQLHAIERCLALMPLRRRGKGGPTSGIEDPFTNADGIGPRRRAKHDTVIGPERTAKTARDRTQDLWLRLVGVQREHEIPRQHSDDPFPTASPPASTIRRCGRRHPARRRAPSARTGS